MLHPLARTCRDHDDRPPADFVAAVARELDAWRVNEDELARAEWLWEHRPCSALFRLMERHPFFALVAFTAATLSLVALLNVLVWACCFATYPLFIYAQARRHECWQRSYRQALARIIRR